MAMEEVISKGEAKEIRERLTDLKDQIADTARNAKDKVCEGTKEWAKEHPGASIGIIAGVAAGVGFALGLMLARSGKD